MSDLVKLENATKMLAEVRDASDAKQLMAMASAAEHYARKAKLGQAAIDYAHAIKIDAERLLGGFLKTAEKATGTRGQLAGKTSSGGTQIEPPEDTTPTLASLGLSKKLSASSQALHAVAEQHPEQFAAVRAGKKSLRKVEKEIRADENQSALTDAQKAVDIAIRTKIDSVCDLRVASCRDIFASGIKPDAVITDPPYPREFLHVFTELAESCAFAGVPLVAVMCGQSYLPEVMALLGAHLRYRWVLAYLTPGGQAVQQWQAKANTTWKPILLFGDAIEWFGDVAASKVNDNDKRFHSWGQSESGMTDVIGRLTKPGQIVCDPFLGGGTTAVASLALGRRFVGCDIDAECVEKTRLRVEAWYAGSQD